jgi:hypothetical protein
MDSYDYPERFFLSDRLTSCDVTTFAELNVRDRPDAPDPRQASLAIAALVNNWPSIRSALTISGTDDQTWPDDLVTDDMGDAEFFGALNDYALKRENEGASKVTIGLKLFRALLTISGNGWRDDMENAPRDGTDIQLYCEDSGEQFVGFNNPAEGSDRPDVFFTAFSKRDGSHIGCIPTHWKPLGPPPLQQPKTGNA